MSNWSKWKAQAKAWVAMIREGNTVPWRKPWEGGFLKPRSVATDKPYSGINVFWLMARAATAGYTSPYWLTYNRARKLGGHVRKGESCTYISYWNFVEKEVEDEDGEVETETIPLVKTFRVFNTDQCELPDDWMDEAGVTPPSNGDADGVDPHDAAEAVVENMPNPPEIVRDKTSARAYYQPSTDRVQVPAMEQFSDVARYYATLFHELGHATGHEDRLNRAELTSGDVRGGDDYSREELVAEMCAGFLALEIGLTSEEMQEQTAAYLEHWIEVIEESPSILMSAATRGEKAARYILGEHEDE